MSLHSSFLSLQLKALVDGELSEHGILLTNPDSAARTQNSAITPDSYS